MFSQQLIIVAGFVNGLGAALLWTAFGTLFPLYATPKNTQRYFGIFWGIFNGVTVVTDFVLFATNIHNTDQQSASSGTLMAFVGVQLAGPLIVFSMQSPEKVVRSDGTPVTAPEAGKPVLEELQGMGRLFVDGRALALIPLYLYTNWCYAYQFNIFNGQLFNFHTKCLNNAFYWGAQIVAPLMMSLFLDSDRPAKMKAYVSFVGITVFVATTWIAGALAHHHYHLGGWKEGKAHNEVLDFTEGGAYIAPLVLYTCWGAADALVQGWSYWIYAQFTDEMEELSRFSGWYKFWNSLGNAFGGFMYSKPFGTMCDGCVLLPRTVQLWINIALFAISVPGSLYCCSTIKGTAQKTATEEFLAKENA